MGKAMTPAPAKAPTAVKTTEALSVAMRPRKLSSMFGMDAAVATLRKQMTTRAPRTILLSGPPGCVDGDSFIDCPRDLVKYPQGIPIRELVGQRPHVYSYDETLKRIVVGKASRVWMTGNKPVYRVTFKPFNDGKNRKQKMPQHIDVTADHPFMLRVNSPRAQFNHTGYEWDPDAYRRADELKPGDRLMPLFRRIEDGYSYMHLNNGECVEEHRFILSELKGQRSRTDYHGHHKNHNTTDNTPSNLEWKTAHDHLSDHTSERNLAGEAGWQKSGVHPRGMAGKPQTDKQRKKASEFHKARHAVKRKAWLKSVGGKRALLHMFRSMSASQIGDKFGVSDVFVYTMLKACGAYIRTKSEAARVASLAYWGKREHNHVVESVKLIGNRDVYNMRVPGPDNYVANGVVVHNCGKTSIARIVAVASQCDHSTIWGDPCDDCRARVVSWSPLQSDFAIHEINAAEHSGVEELEAICRLSYSRPMTGLKRVIILDEVHSLSGQAWKTTLKPMEEPPAHMLWILCTSDVRKVPAANQRRAAKYAMRELGISDTERFLARYAKAAGVTRALAPLVEVCHTMQVGSPGVLLQALDKYAAGASPKDAVVGSDGGSVDSLRICKAVTSGQWPAVAKMLKEMADAGTLAEDTRWIQTSLAGWIRGCLWRATGADAERAAVSLVELSTPPMDEMTRANWLVGVIYRVTARYARR